LADEATPGRDWFIRTISVHYEEPRWKV